MKAFEIHTFTGGKWKIDSVFDDRDLAVFEAQRMESSKRYAGVRVVEENFDEHTQQTATRTIYKGTCLEQAPPIEAPPKRQQAAARPVRSGGGKGQAPRRTTRRPPAQQSGSSNTTLMVILSVIIVVGAAVMVGLRYFAAQG